MKKRLDYIDGIKGLCGVWVCIFHYILAFFPAGYVGWECGVPEAERFSRYFENFPVSILKNASFPLYVFFGLVAFIPALVFFQNHDDGAVRRSALKRYFRLMPPVLACVLAAYAVFACGGMFNAELAADVSCNWNKAFYATELSLPGAIENGLFSAFFFGAGEYCSVLWCINVIFLGSYLSYAVILLFGRMRRRGILYAVLFGLSVLIPNYAAFVAGIAAADLVVSRKNSRPAKGLPELLTLVGCVFGFFPAVLLPNQTVAYLFLGIGAFFALWGCSESEILRKLFSFKPAVFFGRISFALILVHFTVLMSLSAWLFHVLVQNGYGFWPAIVISWGVSAPVIVVLSLLFEKTVERFAERLANRVCAFHTAPENEPAARELPH